MKMAIHHGIKPLRNVLIFFSILFMLAISEGVFAHALLEKATPAPNSELQSSPEKIVLLFNERLENELYSIKVFNDQGQIVSKSKTVLSIDQKQLSQALPSLTNGSYTVSYSVLSADGHPIKGSYIISIGEVSREKVIQPRDMEKKENSILISIVRVIYFISLLFVTGWILWGTFNKEMEKSAEIKWRYRKIALYLQYAFLVANIGMGFVQFTGLLDSWDIGKLLSLLTNTTIGISWSVSMLLSVLGIFMLMRNDWLDRCWVLFVLAAKSVNGHAMAFDPPMLTVVIDFIHLLAAAIWAGGLCYILVYWQKQREHVRKFLMIFSKIALICMMVLIVTGMVSTVIYVPKLYYLLYTKWGILLLVKISLVLLVIILASILRFYIKRKNEGYIGTLVKVDFTLMIVILIIVGIFTRLSPLPQNTPLVWHQNEKTEEFTATISPKVPGNNTFIVEASSDLEGVKIKRIELFLKNNDNPDVAPIQVLFPSYEQAKNAHYMIEGHYLPFAGNWTVEIRILDSEDNESVYNKDFIVY